MQTLVLASLLLAPVAVVSAAGAAFCYDLDEPCGPPNWATLDIPNNECGGTSNSPIDVEDNGCTMFADYELNPGTCGSASMLSYTIDDHVVKASYPSNCTLNSVMIPGVGGPYHALQLHIHLFSEHTIDGNHFPAELHIVHANDAQDRFAVVGMMIQPTALENNPVFEDLIVGWTGVTDDDAATCGGRRQLKKNDDNNNNNKSVSRQLQGPNWNAYDLLPQDTSFYHYDGGLTTPPCSEVVWWNLASKPVEISVRQYHLLSDYILNWVDTDDCTPSTVASIGGSTSRPPVPLGSRSLDNICPLSQAGNGGGSGDNRKGGPKDGGRGRGQKKSKMMKSSKSMSGMSKSMKKKKKSKYYYGRRALAKGEETSSGVRGGSSTTTTN